jgi:hypothetical protein
MTLSTSVKQNLWTLRRFGLSPGKLLTRTLRSKRSDPRIFCVSVPKSGTHLLERALCWHPRLYRKLLPTVNSDNIHKWGSLDDLFDSLRPGQVLTTHLHYQDEYHTAIQNSGVSSIFMIRDPRDLVVSKSFGIAVRKDHPAYRAINALDDIKERMRFVIDGDQASGLMSIREQLVKFSGWFDKTDCTIRFEDTIGHMGGGEKTAQLDTLRAIYTAIGLDMPDEWLAELCENIFSSASPTFRKGTVSQWKKHFDEDIKEHFKRSAGDVLVQYGYEESDEW